jgi:hypothetical protein
MNEDQFWRIFLGAIIIGLIGAFRPQLSKWLYRIGYRGWK